jgi:N-acetylneuraminic acid mutarotase
MKPLAALAVAATLVVGCRSVPAAPSTAPTSASASADRSASAPALASAGATAAAWKRIADIPTGRSEVAVAVSEQQSKVFVIGGSGGPERVELYDLATGTWGRAPDLPIRLDHAMAAAAEGLQSSAPQGVFVFGGYLSGSATARSFRFDAAAGRWEEIAPMPGPRAAAAAVSMGGSIFIVGGADGRGLVAPTYEYNVIAREWRSVAAIPTQRDHLAAAAFGGKVCAVGGRRLSMSVNVAAFECYDPRTDTWAKMPDAPTARGGLGAAAYGNSLYVVGGEQPAGTFREVEIFDLRTNAWKRGPDLPTPRHGLGVVVVQGTKEIVSGSAAFTSARLLVISGGPTPGGSQTTICEAIEVAG